VGALSVYTDSTPDAPGQLLSVLRVTRPLLQQSRVGFVLTHGDPTGETRNTVAGADFQFRTSEFLGGATLQADAFYQRSFSDVFGNDHSFGAVLAFPNEPWNGVLAFKQIGANFAPALGFANRRAIRAYDAVAGYVHRFEGGYLRTLEFSTENRIVTDLSGRLETRESQFSAGVETDPGDEFEVGVANYFEFVPVPFDVADTIIVPAGKYEWTNVELSFETAEARQVAVEAEISCCTFYDGSGVEASIEIGFRPNQYFEIAPSYEISVFDLPHGSVDIHVVTVDSVVNFTPDMQLAIQAQYDNISESFGFLARYRWEYLPGSEFFAALGQSALIPNSRFVMQRTQFAIRLGHTLRF
jgi:hypothetical protein